MSGVLAAAKRNNAQLIADCAALGYLLDTDTILDPTWGNGRFWKVWRPTRGQLLGTDLDPAKSPLGVPVDFTMLPFADDRFDVGVLDGPYKLNGTSTGKGAATSDADYGVTTWASWQDRHALIRAGMTELARVTARTLLVKCQDQVCGGQVRWQTREFADHGETLGFRLKDQLHVLGARAQPARTRKCPTCDGTGRYGGALLCPSVCTAPGCVEGRVASRQQHAHHNYSTLLVLEAL